VHTVTGGAIPFVGQTIWPPDYRVAEHDGHSPGAASIRRFRVEHERNRDGPRGPSVNKLPDGTVSLKGLFIRGADNERH